MVTRAPSAPRVAERHLAESEAVPAAPVDFRLEKDDDTVRLSWEGRAGERFRVARCPYRPTGPMCGRWVTVEGTSWTDQAPADDGLVVYRIERLG